MTAEMVSSTKTCQDSDISDEQAWPVPQAVKDRSDVQFPHWRQRWALGTDGLLNGLENQRRQMRRHRRTEAYLLNHGMTAHPAPATRTLAYMWIQAQHWHQCLMGSSLMAHLTPLTLRTNSEIDLTKEYLEPSLPFDGLLMPP